LTSSSTTFHWTAGTDASGYYLWIGSSPGAHDLLNTAVAGTSYTAALPATGATIYVRLWTSVVGQIRTTLYNDSSYTEFTIIPAAITSPVKGSTLTSASTTFIWTAAVNAAGYELWIGSTPGSFDLKRVYVTGTSYTATLPATGGTIYVRLWTAINGQTRTTLYNDYTYTNQ